MPKEDILVVEDQADLSRLIKLSFEQAGYKVLASCDAESGLPLVRRQESSIPIVFLTGRSTELEGESSPAAFGCRPLPQERY